MMFSGFGRTLTYSELYAVRQLNQRLNDAAELDPSLFPPVRASLCDARFAYFIGHDGKEFSERIVPHARPSETVDAYISSSIDVAQVTFVILLEGYVNVLELYHARSGIQNSRSFSSRIALSPHSSSATPADDGCGGVCPRVLYRMGECPQTGSRLRGILPARARYPL
ncbi:hypothetical protein C8R45DRAFT_485216 [Mycena sanguinolenta]|nr:hypothetical protein C8R45DRAFT_485216 [Mycena sanguinolenta]